MVDCLALDREESYGSRHLVYLKLYIGTEYGRALRDIYAFKTNADDLS